MRRISTASILTVILPCMLMLSACRVSDYNMRVVKEDKNMVQADSASVGTAWLTEAWVEANSHQWASAGVIITSVDNTFNDWPSYVWLTRVINKDTDPFKGVILIEWDMIYVPNDWDHAGNNTFKQDVYQYCNITLDGEDIWVSNIAGNITLFEHPTLGECKILRTAANALWVNGLAALFDEYSTELLTNTSSNPVDIQIGIFKPYKTASWQPYDDFPLDMIALDTDPLTKGYAINSYTSNDFAEFSAYEDDIVYRFRVANVFNCVYGDRVDDTTAQIANRSIKGVFIEDVTPDNVGEQLVKAAAYRESYVPINETDSILIIAGILNDVYHSSQPTDYGNFINTLIQNAMYFTPGADNQYWDYPLVQPGEWWVRVDEDSEWQDNPNNPIYTSYGTHPRQLYAIVLAPIVARHASYAGGGHVWSSAWSQNTDYMMLGSDVTGVYDSRDGGVTWQLHNLGRANDQDVGVRMVQAAIAIDNDYFTGYVIGAYQGAWYIDIPYEADTPWTAFIDGTTENYIYEYQEDWQSNGEGWKRPFGFSSFAWDGNDMVVATAGKARYTHGYDIYYPFVGFNGVVDYPIGGVVEGAPPIGIHGLFRYIYSDTNPYWQPVAQALDGGIAGSTPDSVHVVDWGCYKDVDVAIFEGDTLYVIATSNGVKMLTKNGLTETWEQDADDWTWADADGNVFVPSWTLLVSYTEQTVWKVNVTDRGDVYACIATKDYDWESSSGLYKKAFDETVFRWVGDDSGTIPSQQGVGHDGVLLSVRDIGEGEFSESRLAPSGNSWEMTAWHTFSMHEGSGAAPDSVWMGGWEQWGRVVYAEVPYNVNPNNTTWGPDETLGIYGEAFADNKPFDPGILTPNWGYWAVHAPALHPFSVERMYYFANDKLALTKDKGATWSNIGTENNPNNTNYYRSTGWDEICHSMAGVLSDGRVIVTHGDVYPSISEDSSWDYFIAFQPNDEYASSNCWSENNSERPWSAEGIPIVISRDWYGYEDEDIIFYASSDPTQWTNPGQLFWISDNNGDYDFFDTDEWVNLSTDENYAANLRDPSTYMYSGQLAVDGPGRRIWIPYVRDSFPICYSAFTSADYFESGAGNSSGDPDFVCDLLISSVYGKADSTSCEGTLEVLSGPGAGIYDVKGWDTYTLTLVSGGPNNATLLGNVAATTEVTIRLTDDAGKQQSGVIQFSSNGSSWTVTLLDESTLTSDAAYYTGVYYSESASRLFLVAKYSNSSPLTNAGGIWYYDLISGDGNWHCVFGEKWIDAPGPNGAGGYGTETTGTNSSEDYGSSLYGAVNALGLSSDGTTIYIGTTGGSGQHGAIFKAVDITVDSDEWYWELCINPPGDDWAELGSILPLVPAIDGGTSIIYNDRSWDTSYEIAERQANFNGVMVDPFENSRVWFINGDAANTAGGLYALDTVTHELARVFPDDERSWDTWSKTVPGLQYTNTTVVPRMMWPVSCAGMSWMEYSGEFPTGNYGDGPDIYGPGEPEVPDNEGQLAFEQTGVGGGGWMWGGAFHPDNPDVMIFGADQSGTYYTTNGGLNWEPWNNGLANDYNVSSFYVRGCVGVSNEYFNGFVATTSGGIFSRQLNEDTWTSLTPSRVGAVIGGDPQFVYDPVGDGKWVAYRFNCVEWDGANTLYVGAGRKRVRSASVMTLYDYSGYPMNVDDDTDGRYSLWEIDMTQDPMVPVPVIDMGDISGYGTGLFGTIRDISYTPAIEGTEIYLACATTEGVFMSNGTNWYNLTLLDTDKIFYNGVSYDFGDFSVTGTIPVSVHVTSRGSVYMGIWQGDSTADFPSGVYKLWNYDGDATHIWQYVGDSDKIAEYWADEDPTGISLDDWAVGGDGASAGVSPYDVGQFASILVFDGAVAAPDTVWVFDRTYYFTANKTTSPYSEVYNTEVWEPIVWSEVETTWDDSFDPAGRFNFDPGWYDTRSYAIMPPFTYKKVGGGLDQNHIMITPGDRADITQDGGTTWIGGSTIALKTSNKNDGHDNVRFWHTTGYEENVPWSFAFFADGRAMVGNADHGPMASKDNEYYWWEYVAQPSLASADSNVSGTWSVDGLATVTGIWDKDVGPIEIIADLPGSQYGEVAIIAAGDTWQYNNPCRMMMYHDDNSDGRFDEDEYRAMGEYIYQTLGIAQNQLQFHTRHMAVVEDSLVFIPYIQFDDVAGTGEKIETGIMRFAWDEDFDYPVGGTVEGAWWATRFNSGITAGDKIWWKDIVYSASSDKLFACAEHAWTTPTSWGGVISYDLGGGSEWVTVIGQILGDTGIYDAQNDFWSLATSSSGDVIYAGADGHSGYVDSQLWKCENPEDATPDWAPMVSHQADSLYFNIPNPINNVGWSLDNDVERNQKQLRCRYIHVDLEDDNILYLGMYGRGNHIDSSAGLWRVDQSTNTWTNLALDNTFIGNGVYTIEETPDSEYLLIGTNGLGMYVARKDSTVMDWTIVDQTPVITTVSTDSWESSGTVVLAGRNFGRERSLSQVLISDSDRWLTTPTIQSIDSWANLEITFTVVVDPNWVAGELLYMRIVGERGLYDSHTGIYESDIPIAPVFISFALFNPDSTVGGNVTVDASAEFENTSEFFATIREYDAAEIDTTGASYESSSTIHEVLAIDTGADVPFYAETSQVQLSINHTWANRALVDHYKAEYKINWGEYTSWSVDLDQYVVDTLLTIPKGVITSVRVVAVDALGVESDYTSSPVGETANNQATVIVGYGTGYTESGRSVSQPDTLIYISGAACKVLTWGSGTIQEGNAITVTGLGFQSIQGRGTVAISDVETFNFLFSNIEIQTATSWADEEIQFTLANHVSWEDGDTLWIRISNDDSESDIHETGRVLSIP